ncbi:GATA zinc finger domain-containing protein 14-like [Planococcus citri]|uniref:GATA zinc finger domain-containing protein 14-like n=1 Tax=Planococcus citri TaxID=170843 RepID=UPI0031F9046B
MLPQRIMLAIGTFDIQMQTPFPELFETFQQIIIRLSQIGVTELYLVPPIPPPQVNATYDNVRRVLGYNWRPHFNGDINPLDEPFDELHQYPANSDRDGAFYPPLMYTTILNTIRRQLIPEIRTRNTAASQENQETDEYNSDDDRSCTTDGENKDREVDEFMIDAGANHVAVNNETNQQPPVIPQPTTENNEESASNAENDKIENTTSSTNKKEDNASTSNNSTEKQTAKMPPMSQILNQQPILRVPRIGFVPRAESIPLGPHLKPSALNTEYLRKSPPHQSQEEYDKIASEKPKKFSTQRIGGIEITAVHKTPAIDAAKSLERMEKYKRNAELKKKKVNEDIDDLVKRTEKLCSDDDSTETTTRNNEQTAAVLELTNRILGSITSSNSNNEVDDRNQADNENSKNNPNKGEENNEEKHD